MCVNDPGNTTANGAQIQISTCGGQASQQWTMEPDGTLRIHGKCLDVARRSKLERGRAFELATCQSSTSQPGASQHWAIESSGELFNLNSGRCAADPGDSTANNTGLVQEDC